MSEYDNGHRNPAAIVMNGEEYGSVESFNDTHEVGALEGSATDETTVNIGFCEDFAGIGGLAAAAVEDAGVVGDLLAVLAGDDVADVGVHVLSLVGGSGLAGTDSPYGFVGEDHVAEFFRSELEESLFNLGLNHIVVAAVLALLEHFANAEDGLETVGKGESELLAEDCGSLAVVLAAFAMAENHIFCTGGGNHGGAHLAGIYLSQLVDLKSPSFLLQRLKFLLHQWSKNYFLFQPY